MKLATFTHEGHTRVGLVLADTIVDLSSDVTLPGDMIGFLDTGDHGLARARTIARNPGKRIPLADLRLEAPVLRPRKFLGLGGSYESHLREVTRFGISRPKHQQWFNKQVTCVNGPYDDIHMPAVSPSLDYEVELAIVIGKAGRNIKAGDAKSMIAGFTICNDVSVREWQMRSPTATLGKSFDTHGPIGPWIVTPDELPNSGNLRLRTWVNGELRQDGNTGELIYQFGERSFQNTLQCRYITQNCHD